MKTVKQVGLVAARENVAKCKHQLADAKAHVRELLDGIKADKVAAKAEREAARVTRQAAKAAKAQAVKDRKLAQIAKLEAKLAALREKQFDPKEIRRKNRKAGPVIQITV